MEQIHNYILENWAYLCKIGFAGLGFVAVICFAGKTINGRWRGQRTDAKR